jgi:DNA-binding NtrC family response regulator
MQSFIKDIRYGFRMLLKGKGYQITTVTSPSAVLKEIEANDFDVVLVDLNYTLDTTSGKEGLDLITRIQEHDAMLPVVVMTAWGNVELAVEVMRRGARDFVEKPWDNARFLSVIKTQIELSQSLRKNEKLEAENLFLRDSANRTKPILIAESPAMLSVVEMVKRIAPSDANVLITGENGSGKKSRCAYTSLFIFTRKQTDGCCECRCIVRRDF